MATIQRQYDFRRGSGNLIRQTLWAPLTQTIQMTRRKIYEHLIGTNVFGIRDKIKAFKKPKKRKNEKV